MSDMGSSTTASLFPSSVTGEVPPQIRKDRSEIVCPVTEGPDARRAGLFVAVGLLIAVACVGLWPTPSYQLPSLVLSFAGGFLLAALTASTLPAYYRHVIPLLTLAGGASVTVSVRMERTIGDAGSLGKSM